MSTLVALFHNRWSVPILAELHRQRGSRFVTLARTLGISRESLRRTLAALIESGLVGRNPGYGHPLRPEYVLTNSGEHIAAACRPLVERLRSDGLEDVALKKWSMPVVFALGDAPRRFRPARHQRLSTGDGLPIDENRPSTHDTPCSGHGTGDPVGTLGHPTEPHPGRSRH
jgi:DNA-binding HxlR family transcriptional regulator